MNDNDIEPGCVSIWFPIHALILENMLMFMSRPARCPLYFILFLFCLPNCICLVPIVLLCWEHIAASVNQLPLLLMHGKTTAISPLMCPYQMNVAYYRRGGVSWVALWTKKGPARDHERDIVQYRPYSSFVDKWIFMLINSDTDMSENCGECGIILTPRPYTWTTVVSSVCGLSLSCLQGFFIWVCHSIWKNIDC